MRTEILQILSQRGRRGRSANLSELTPYESHASLAPLLVPIIHRGIEGCTTGYIRTIGAERCLRIRKNIHVVAELLNSAGECESVVVCQKQAKHEHN